MIMSSWLIGVRLLMFIGQVFVFVGWSVGVLCGWLLVGRLVVLGVGINWLLTGWFFVGWCSLNGAIAVWCRLLGFDGLVFVGLQL